MFKYELEKDRFLVVDFEGLLTPREEEISGYRILGKSTEAISEITGIKPDSVKKHSKNSYTKLNAKGADNPLAALTLFAFNRGFAKFAALVLAFATLFQAPNLSSQAVRIRTVNARRANRDENGFSLIEVVCSILPKVRVEKVQTEQREHKEKRSLSLFEVVYSFTSNQLVGTPA